MFEILCQAAFDGSSTVVFSARISPIFHVLSHEYLWDPMSVELSLDNRYDKQQLGGLVISLVCPFWGLYKKQKKKGWKCPSVCGFPCFNNWLRLYLVCCQPNQGRNKEIFLAERNSCIFFCSLCFFQFADLPVRRLVTLHFNFTLYEQNYRCTYLTWRQNCFLL